MFLINETMSNVTILILNFYGTTETSFNPPHVKAISCEFDIVPGGIETDLISTVWSSREYSHYIHWG